MQVSIIKNTKSSPKLTNTHWSQLCHIAISSFQDVWDIALFQGGSTASQQNWELSVTTTKKQILNKEHYLLNRFSVARCQRPWSCNKGFLSVHMSCIYGFSHYLNNLNIVFILNNHSIDFVLCIFKYSKYIFLHMDDLE